MYIGLCLYQVGHGGISCLIPAVPLQRESVSKLQSGAFFFGTVCFDISNPKPSRNNRWSGTAWSNFAPAQNVNQFKQTNLPNV